MFRTFHLLVFLTSLLTLTSCASSSSGGKVSLGGKQRTVDFCSRPSDIGTALACEVGKLGAELAIDAAADAYKSASRKNMPQKTSSEKKHLLSKSDDEICEGAYGVKNTLASHQYVAKLRKLDCLRSYTNEKLCESISKKHKLMKISQYHANSTSFKESLLKMQSEKDRRSLDC